jgi:hypothetical protein
MAPNIPQLSAEWPDWNIRPSHEGRYLIATYRHTIPAAVLLSGTATYPGPTVIAESTQELASLLSAEPTEIEP